MKKIIFINPSIDKLTDTSIWNSKLIKALKGREEKNTLMPKLSAMILAALTPKEYSFTYIDEDVEEDMDFDMMEADLVLITAFTMQSIRAYQISGEFRKRGIKVILGGIHGAVRTEEASDYFDSIMIGECENIWSTVLEDFENEKLKKKYDAKDFAPVEKLVSPKVDIFKHDKYLTYPIQATRGCPYNCDFCSIQFSSGNKYRMKPVEQVVQEIKEYEKYNENVKFLGKKTYYFVDDNLYVNRNYVIELFTALKELNIVWDGQGTVNTAKDDDVVKLMAESGCRSFSFGFESISPESLKEANKPIHNVVEYYGEAINKLQKHGIIAGGYFIMGFDSDDVTIFRKTTDFIKQVNLVQAFFNILTPYPGTRLYNRFDSEKRIFSKSWTSFNQWKTVFTPKNMSAEDLQAGVYWAGIENCSLDYMRQSLKKFWDIGSWENRPTFTISERLILILLGIKLKFNKLGDYQKFLFWTARQKGARDFKTILWMLMRHEITVNITRPYYDPAQKINKSIKH